MDWFLRTRTKEELHARCNLLFYMLEKQNSTPTAVNQPDSLQNAGNVEKVKTPKGTRYVKKEKTQKEYSAKQLKTGITLTQKRKTLERMDSPRSGKLPKLELEPEVEF